VEGGVEIGINRVDLRVRRFVAGRSGIDASEVDQARLLDDPAQIVFQQRFLFRLAKGGRVEVLD